MEVLLVVSGRGIVRWPRQDVVRLFHDERFLLLLSVEGVPRAAASIGVSERTLRRAAVTTGTCVRAVVCDFQCMVTEKLFREGSSVCAVAARLGYSPGASFGRFITREYGMPPSVLRRRLLQGSHLPALRGPRAPLAHYGRLERLWPDLSILAEKDTLKSR
jgi:AraC-like DNA-binding protein